MFWRNIAALHERDARTRAKRKRNRQEREKGRGGAEERIEGKGGEKREKQHEKRQGFGMANPDVDDDVPDWRFTADLGKDPVYVRHRAEPRGPVCSACLSVQYVFI